MALVDRLLSRLEDYTSNLEDLVQERTEQLVLEKRKSEMLLDEILPRFVFRLPFVIRSVVLFRYPFVAPSYALQM